MDRGPVVGADPSNGHIRVEQAIFTSVRSRMGSGYRLIAASPGLTAAERREITQRSPSHGNLIAPGSAAHGLSSYLLSSGRRAVALSRFAGFEHTARGGQRVHTHVVVLSGGDFRRCQCDPLRIRHALLRTVGDQPLLDPPQTLDQTSLSLNGVRPAKEALTALTQVPPQFAERLSALLAHMLARHCAAVVGGPEPEDVVARLLSAVPLGVREDLSLSWGLKFSASRRFGIVFVGGTSAETQRVIHGQDVVLFDWNAPPAPEPSPHRAWLGFARRYWESGRTGELDRLCARLTNEATDTDLDRIAGLSEDLERVRRADRETHSRLVRKYATFRATNPVLAYLLRDFHAAANLRGRALAAQESGHTPEPSERPRPFRRFP
jgi:hypothetical protein